MAAVEDFFSQFRSFASTLDKDCCELKSKLEDNEISADEEGRSHLVLRGILSEAIQLKREAVLKSTEMKQMFSFGEFLQNCEKLAEHTKTQIEDLQEHLTKYGYKSPGQLPSVDSIYEAVSNKESTSMDTDGTDGSLDNSQSEDDVVAMETDAKSSDEGCKDQEKKQDEDEDDCMSTPVKPVTFTPMIQATPPPLPTQGRPPKDTQNTPEQSPVRPKTTTPMINIKHVPQKIDDKSLHSPPSNDTTPQPMTFTPQPHDDSPLPPVFCTPGVKLISQPGDQEHGVQSTQGCAQLPSYFHTPTPPRLNCTTLLKPEDLESGDQGTGHKEHGRQRTQGHCQLPSYFDTPTPPKLMCTTLLKPDDLEGQGTSRALTDSLEYPTLHPVLEDEYVTLPGYVKTQFSIDDINELLLSIQEFLMLQTKESNRQTLKEEVLREAFCLGRKTKAFMLALKKLGRAEVTNGVLVFTS